MAGGGGIPRPGEVSLAHNGVLFLDEFPEFSSRILETLRQPIEEGRILLVRSVQTHLFPARFMLVAAMNPCPCGWRGHPVRPCTCTPLQVKRYRDRISGPLLDRIDLHVEVPAVEVDALERGEGEPSAAVALRVAAARERARTRLAGLKHHRDAVPGPEPRLNAALGPAHLRRLPAPEEEARRLLARAARAYHLSARTYHRLLKVAWTIADLDASPILRAPHMSEALHYRMGEREGVMMGARE